MFSRETTMKTIRKTICVLVSAAFLSACSTMTQAPYAPADSPPPPVESTTNDDAAAKAVIAVVAVALLAGLVVLARGIPFGVPAMH